MFFEELSGMADLSHLTHLTPPRDDTAARNLRRKRVQRLTCKRGRVCSGTPPCPCRPVQMVTLDEWQQKMTTPPIVVDLSPVLVMDGRHRMAAIAALAGK